jgi:hypothetical protein
VKAEAAAYLDALWRQGAPLGEPTHDVDGARREPFDLGPQMLEFAARPPRYQAGIAELYAVWAYGHFAGRWDNVRDRQDQVAEIFDRFAARPLDFDPDDMTDDMTDDAAQRLNREIAGVLGAVRLFERSGDDGRRRRALDLLAALVTTRVHHERADHRLVRPTRGESGGIHQAKVPRYVDLAPEVAGMLGRFAGPELEAHLAGLRRLPLWGHAYGERMIGGENYISPLHLSRGVFAAWSGSGGATVEQLARDLDQPWCGAYLSFIDKLTSAITG